MNIFLFTKSIFGVSIQALCRRNPSRSSAMVSVHSLLPQIQDYNVIVLAFLFIFDSCRLWRPSWICGNTEWTDIIPHDLDGLIVP